MEDTPCFSNRNEAIRFSEYRIIHENADHILYDHIKYGNGYDNANQIRIYYVWLESEKIFLIGKMPSHLRNNHTN